MSVECFFQRLLDIAQQSEWLTRIWAAVGFSISATGATYVGVAIAFVYSAWRIVPGLHRVGRKDLTAKSLAKSTLVPWCLIWSFLFTYNYRWPQYTPAQIFEYGHGLLAAVSRTRDENAMATGFWVDRRGYLATCLPIGGRSSAGESITVGAMNPPLLTGKMITVIGGIHESRGIVMSHDLETGLALVRVERSPFERERQKFLMFAEAIDRRTGCVERVTERCYVASVASSIPKLGDLVYVAAVGPPAGKLPTIALLPGNVTRLLAIESVKSRFLRIETSITFQPTYIGAPVVNKLREVVGIVGLPTTGSQSVTLVPSKYVQDEILTLLKPT